ncbi:MAG: radical SAM protein [Christensenella sp.]
MKDYLKNCKLCSCACGVNRADGQVGRCGASARLKVARAALHFWEEPCISGEVGSGTVFFSYCPLGCVYCQNAEISSGAAGAEITTERLADIFLELQQSGAANINLVTPTHYAPQIAVALADAKARGLFLPIVYNCGGYEGKDSLDIMDGLADIYLTDFKYMSNSLAKKYSNVSDYSAVAGAALKEMVRQTGAAVFDENGMLQKGVIVRCLLLPNCLEDAKEVVRYVYEAYGNNVYLSLMSQYTPMCKKRLPQELRRRVTDAEYNALIDYAVGLGVENGFVQEGAAAEESFIPTFDLTGVHAKQITKKPLG